MVKFVSSEYIDGITELYHGEIVGEGLFSELLLTCDLEHEQKIGSMLQLETEGKARLRPLLARYGIPLTEPEAVRQSGVDFARVLAVLPWQEAMGRLAGLSRPYLERYISLSAMALPEDRGEIDFMVVHEQAVVDFADLESVGRSDDAIRIVSALLERPIYS